MSCWEAMVAGTLMMVMADMAIMYMSRLTSSSRETSPQVHDMSCKVYK